MTRAEHQTETYSSLDELPDNETAIFGDIDPNLFYSEAWFKNYEKTITPDSDNEVIHVVNRITAPGVREPVAMHLMKVEETAYGPFGYKTLASLANFYSTYHNILLSRDADHPQAIQALADKLDENKGAYTAFSLGPVVEDDESARLIRKALREKGWFTYYYAMFGNWRLQVNGRSFEEYYQTVPSRTRNTIKRKEKKLLKEHDVEYRLFTDMTDLELAIESFNEVYNHSWKTREPYPDFIRGLIELAAANHWLRLGVLTIDNSPAAAQLWIVKDGTAYIYKLAYTEALKKLSAGSILTRNLFQHVIDTDKVKIIDYLTGDDAYKKDWMSERRQMVGLMAYSNTFRGNVLTAAHKAKRLIKSVLNK